MESQEETNEEKFVGMDVVLKYGGGKISIAIPEKARASILEPLKVPVLASVKASLEQSLAEPLGSPSLEKIVSRSRPRSIAIAVPDETRPAPLGEILPPLLSRMMRGKAVDCDRPSA